MSGSPNSANRACVTDTAEIASAIQNERALWGRSARFIHKEQSGYSGGQASRPILQARDDFRLLPTSPENLSFGASSPTQLRESSSADNLKGKREIGVGLSNPRITPYPSRPRPDQVFRWGSAPWRSASGGKIRQQYE
jgi:hypothetical protein